MTKTLYLIDGHAQVYRAYHAVRGLNAADGTPTGATYGMARMLLSLIERYDIEHLAAVFDPQGPTFRHQMDASYKAHRQPMPEELQRQIPDIFELCRGYHIPTFQVEGYEADDVLGTIACRAAEQGAEVVIVSGDKDLLQLVGQCAGRIRVYDPQKDLWYGPEEVVEKRGLRPEQIPDLIGLWGDSSDGIPGVAKVGEKTATQLLQQHGTLERVLAAARQKKEEYDRALADYQAGRIDPQTGKKNRPPQPLKAYELNLVEQAEQARASKEMATIRQDVRLDFNLESCRRRQPDPGKLLPLFQRLNFTDLLRTVVKAAPANQSDYVVVDSEEKFADFLQRLQKQPRFAVDLETDSPHPTRACLVGLSFCWRPGQAFYLPLKSPQAERNLDPVTVLTALKAPLEDPRVGKIGQNIKYDLIVLRRHGIKLSPVVFDTMIAAWVDDPGQQSYRLERLALSYLAFPKTTTKEIIGSGKAQTTMDLVDLDTVAGYASEDVDVTWRLSETLAKRLDQQGLRKLYEELELPLVEVLAEMELAGVRVDPQMLGEMAAALAATLEALEEDIYQAAGTRFAVASPKQLAEVLFDRLGLPVAEKSRKTGEPSTNERVLQKLASRHPLPRLVLEHRALSKLKSTYVEALPALINPETGRIHASFHQTGTATGRLSASDPNLQNVPVRSQLGRSIRAAFLPQAGWKLLAADYSQIELRLLAHVSGDAALREAFRKGADVHRSVAARLAGIEEAEVTPQQRAAAKAVNFGIIYGQTAFGLAQTLGLEPAQAQKIIDEYFASHPAVRQTLDEIVRRARGDGYVVTLLGRRRYLPDLEAGDLKARRAAERMAVNTVFQGSAADLIKRAMVNLHRELSAGGFRARLILQIHDELVFETPPEEIEALSELVVEQMRGAIPLEVPLVVAVGVGDSWLEVK